MTRLRLCCLVLLTVLAGARAQAAGIDPPACDVAGMTAPVPLTPHVPPPELYPPLSAMLGESGTTVVHYVIRTDGTAAEARVETSSGSLRLDDAAIGFVAGFKFRPAVLAGKPTECTRRIGVRWLLQSSGDQTFSQLPATAIYPSPDDYPSGAIDRREGGVMVCLVVMDENGAMQLTLPIAATPYPDLNAATIRLLQRQKITPPMLNGKPLRFSILIRVIWSPTGAPQAPAADGAPAAARP